MTLRKIFLLALLAVTYSWSASVSFPAAPVPTGRFATGIGYDYNGGFLHNIDTVYGIDNLAFKTRGLNAFFTYGIVQSINLGVDIGVRDVRIRDNNLAGWQLLPRYDNDGDLIAIDTLLTRVEFKGRFGLAAGAHLKLSTPYIGDVMAIVGTARGNWFYSETYGSNSWHNGLDFTAGGGLSFNVNDFGYITLGAKYFEIMGKNGINAHEGDGMFFPGNDGGYWSNSAVMGGFIAVDYFPKSNIQQYIPFFSFEFSFFPDKNGFSGSNPVLRSAGFAVTAGAFSRRVVGDKDEIWRP